MTRRRGGLTIGASPAGKDLVLPVEAITEPIGWTGNRGSGKSYGAQVFAEELLRRDDVEAIAAGQRRRIPERVESIPPEERRSSTEILTDVGGRLGARERKILDVLAMFPARCTKAKLVLLTGYSARASTIGAGLSHLRKVGAIEAGSNPIRLTATGRALAGDPAPVPSGPALIQFWRAKIGTRERAILDALLDAARAGRVLSKDEIAAATGYSKDASTIEAGLSNLRAAGIVEKRGTALLGEFIEAIS